MKTLVCLSDAEPGGTSEARLGLQVSLVSKSNICEWGLGLPGGAWGRWLGGVEGIVASTTEVA